MSWAARGRADEAGVSKLRHWPAFIESPRFPALSRRGAARVRGRWGESSCLPPLPEIWNMTLERRPVIESSLSHRRLVR